MNIGNVILARIWCRGDGVICCQNVQSVRLGY